MSTEDDDTPTADHAAAAEADELRTASRAAILGAKFNQATEDVPEWGGLVTLRGIPIGAPEMLAFIEAPVETKRPRGAGKKANPKANTIKTPPSATEMSRRSIAASVIWGAYEYGTDKRLFTVADHKALREGPQWPVCVRVAGIILELTNGPDLEQMGKS